VIGFVAGCATAAAAGALPTLNPASATANAAARIRRPSPMTFP
jgi:hypothetical protein